ncbi:CBS domain-containing protein [Marinobacter koreensis]|uniref:CBS domain-containing protein n=1 Tax=Marinobacter koreensis TaxID=335974 RepID=A0ABW0RL61_9GAMM|nr:CBS domain-containing protein [Marinobacter koreensis]MCK7548306.1 CBS domain-containing protein [Marinobacter koreensis]
MSIFVSEPGRPVGTRLPEALRSRRVGDVTELTESHPIVPGQSTVTDGEYQQAAHSGRQRALQEYSAASAGEAREQRPYLPVSELCSPVLFSVPATATVSEALTTMDDNGVHHLIVTAGENVAGLIDLKWLLSWIHAQSASPMEQSLSHIELPAFLTASTETDAHQLARLMLAHQLNAALVMDGEGQPKGVVTSTDFLRIYAAGAGGQEGAV